jgi:hypothetical protein
MYILKKMHDAPDESNFTDESGHATKPYRTEDYSPNRICGQIRQNGKQLRNKHENSEVD